MNLSGRLAVVTGGASGIGRSICARLAADGADVAVFDVNEAGARETVHAIEPLGRRALAVEVDVSDAAAVAAAVDHVVRELGAAQILVNDAGICAFVPFLEM